MIGAGARRLIERGLELEGRSPPSMDISRLTSDFIDHYAAHIADFRARSRAWKARSMSCRRAATDLRSAPTSWSGCRSSCSTAWD